MRDPYTFLTIARTRAVQWGRSVRDGRRFPMQLRFRHLILTAVAALGLVAAEHDSARVLMEAAKKKEVVDGDLKAAIKQYGDIADLYGKSNRAAAATALVRMAECYAKLSDSESRKIYERVVQEYTDQKDAVATARARLGTTTSNAGAITRQVWTGPKVDAGGTVSPDGRLLSYTDWATGDLAIHDFTTGKDRRLTNKGTWNDSSEYAVGSAISRDGRQVAYGWAVPGADPSASEHFEVRVIDVVGGKPRILVSQPEVGFASVSDWSLGGRWLAVKLGRADGSSQIGLVSTADGTVRVLKSKDWGGPFKVVFSPDAKYLAYDLPVSDDAGQRDVYVMPIDGSRETPVVGHPSNDRLLGWSPDGKYLLFSSERSGLPGLWAVPIAGGKPQGMPELIKANVNPASLGLAKSGTLYYSVLTAGRDIFVASMDFEAGKVLAPSTVIPQPYLGLNDSPQWSPDGKYLAYFSSKDGNSGNRMTALAIRSMETGKVRELRPDLAYLNGTDYSRPLWSPDASSFFVAAADKKGRQGIYRVDAQTGQSTPVVLNSGQEYPIVRAVSPNGRTLIISRRVLNGSVLSVRDLQSGSEIELVRRWGLGDSPVSPDGRFVAVTAFDRDRSSSLLVIPVEGGEPRELLRVSDPEWLGGLAAWSPDGRSLLFRKYLVGATRREVSRIPVEGGVPRGLGLEFAVGRSPNIHPDGRQVAFTTIDGPKHEVWALENFLPTAKDKK